MPAATKDRIELAEALALAREFAEILEPACERIAIAGSIRRETPTIGDIEILAVPRLQEGEPERDIFGAALGPIPRVSELDLLLSDLAQDGRLGMRLDKNGRPAMGDRYKRLMWRGAHQGALFPAPGFALDLFIVRPDSGQQWGVLMAIRTGPHEYSKQLVTVRGKKTPDMRPGLLSPICKVEDARLWRGGVFVATPEEADFFREADIEMREPRERW